MKKFTIFMLVLALIIPTFLVSALTKTDWPNMLRDSAHTNYQPDANIPDVMQRNWVYYPEKGGSIFGHVAVDDKVYFGTSNGEIICVMQENGEEVWKTDLGVKGMVSVGYNSDTLSYICMVDNKEPKEEEPPAEGGRGGSGGRGGRGGGGGHPMSVNSPLQVLEAKTNIIIGALSPTDGSAIYSEPIVEPNTISGGLMDGDKAYILYTTYKEGQEVSSPSTLKCLNIADMSEAWSFDYDLSLTSIITKGDDKIFATGMKVKYDPTNPMGGEVLDSEIVAFTTSGEIAWTQKLSKGEQIGMISYADDVIYHPLRVMPENTGIRQMPSTFIVARDASNGEEKWRFGLKEIKWKDHTITEGAFFGSPAITDYGLVVQGYINHTICLSFDGNLKWVNETPGGMAFTGIQLACSKDKIVSSRGSKFSIAKASTGEIIFVDDMKMGGTGMGGMMRGEMPIMPFPIIANDKVFICGDRIICYGEKVIGLYSDPATVLVREIYPEEEKSRKVKVFYNDTGEIDGTLEAKADWIKLSSTEYKTLSQIYDVTLSAAGLEPGKYESTIEVTSTVGNLSIPVVMNVLPKPPIKLEIALEDRTITNENPFPVDGTTQPGATLSVNGRPISVKTDGTFSDQIPIKEGINELKFHAEDDKGNIADVTKIVELDDKKPTIRAAVSDGQRVTSLPYEFYGTTEPGAKLLVNDEPVEVKSNGEFTVVIDGVENGEYEINMVSKDPAGNTFKLKKMIVIDASPIEIELTLPMPGYDGSKEPAYTLKGKTEPMVYVIATIDGNPVGQGMTGPDGSFEIPLKLAGDGQFKVTVVAKSQDGKESNPVEFTLIIDSTPPMLEVDLPEIVNNEKLTITGKTEPMTAVFVGENKVAVGMDGAFTYDIMLKKGINVVTIKAVDMLGNETIIEKYIKLEDKVKTTRLMLWTNTPRFVKNGEPAPDLDPMPTTQSPPLPEALAGNSYMPVRAIFEALGAKVDWIGDDRRVDVKLGDVMLQLWVDNNSVAKINGVETKIIGADGSTVLYPTIVNGRTMLPLRFACEALKADVNWIADEKAIEIVYPSEK